MNYYSLAKEARIRLRRKEGDRGSWLLRLQDVSIRIGNALVEMGDLDGAARYLEALPKATTTSLTTQLALLYLTIGDVEKARSCLDHGTGDDDELNHAVASALPSIADGDFDAAIGIMEPIVFNAPSKDIAGHDLLLHNLAICYMYTGRIQDVSVLETGTIASYE